jgi:hypothetical protein
MTDVPQRPARRKYPTRIKFVGLLGSRRRYRWSAPFTTAVYRYEPMVGR